MSDTDLAFRATLDGSGFASGAQQITGQLQQMGIQTQTATIGLGGIGTVLGTMANPATAAALGITAIGGALASSVGVAANFESAMSRVASVAGASQADLERMSTAAREAGASSVFSASQAADAMYFLASSGMTVDQQITSLGSTLDLASAGGLELARSAEVMTSSLSQFGLGADQADRVANLFAATSAAANTDVEQLGQAMKEAGPMAASLGISIEQTSAAIASLSNAGIKGSQAGTALKSMLGSMMQETKTGTAALAEMGLTYENINPAANSYADIMGTLAEKNMTASQAVAIFGKEQASAALAAVNGAKDLETLEEKITGTSKATEMSAQMTDNYNGAMEELGGAIEEAQITLGNAFLPSLTSGVKFLTNMTNAATDTAKAIGDLAGAWNDWVASSVSDSAELERQYEETNKGHWEMIAGDAVWIGEDFGKAISDGIKESDDLKTAAAEALDTPEAKAAMEASAKESAQTWVESFGDAAEKGMTALTDKDGNFLGWSSSSWTREVDKTIREFEYMGQKWKSIAKEGGSDTRQWYLNDKLIGQTTEAMSPAESFMAVTGYAPPDESSAAYYGMMGEYGKAEIAKLREKLESEKVPLELFTIVDRDAMIDTATDALRKSLTDAWSDGKLYDAEKSHLKQLAFEYEAAGGDMSDALVQAIKAGDWAAAGKYAGEEFVDALTGTIRQMKIPSIDEVLADPELQAKIMDLPDFLENTFNPALKKSFDDQYAITKLGYDDDISQTKAWIDEKEKIYQEHANWFSDWQQELFRMYAGNEISAEDFMWVWNEMSNTASKSADEIGKATEKASVGYDQLGKALEDCNECMSDFGNWQEAQTDLFQDSYIGRGGQAYLDWNNQQISAIAETQAAMDAVGGAVLGQRYDMPSYTMQVDADTNTAEAKKESLIAEITSANPILRMELDTSIADSRFQNFFNLVQNSRPVMYFDAIPLVDIGAIAAAVESALRSAGI